MPISSNSTITNQFVPDFKITDLVNGNILVYNSTEGAFVNTNTIGSHVIINQSNLAPHSVGPLQLDTSNNPVSGYVLGVDVNGDLTYLSLISGGSGALSGLVDTGINTPVANQVLKYDGLLWVNSTLDVSDVATITTPANKDILFYDGASWVNKQLEYADLDNVPSMPTNNSFSFIGLGDTNNTVVNDGFLRWNSNGTQIDYSATIAAIDVAGLSTVATTGDYSDLSNLPNLAIYAQTGSLAPVATTGDYSSLTGTPFIATTLNGLTDVTISGPVTGHLLQYNGSQWVNAAVGIPYSITQLNDVNISSPTLGEVLKWDGADWVDSQVSWTEITGKPSTFAPAVHTQTAASITDLASWVSLNQNYVTFVGLGDTSNTIVNNGFLRWNSTGTQIDYTASIPYTSVSGISTVGHTGAYSDLIGAPTLAPVATLGTYSSLTGLPTLYTTLSALTDTNITSPLANHVLSYDGMVWKNVSFSYNNLSNLPTLFDGTWGSLSGKPLTFTATPHSHVMADISDLSIPTSINDLSDVDTSGIHTPAYGQTLRWSGINWIPSNLVLSNNSLNDLGDTTITSPLSSQYLRYNGSQWVNSTLDFNDLSNAPSTYAPSAHTHLAADVLDLSSWLISNQSSVTFTGISQTNNTPVNNGFLRWNSNGTQINYSATISSADIIGLGAAAYSNDYGDLSNTPYVPTSLDNLSDVNLTTPPVSSNVLRFDGTDWKASPVYYSQISGTPTNATYSFVGLNDTNNSVVNGGYLKWNSIGSSIEYTTTIPYTAITGLSDVGHTGDYSDLLNAPTIPTNNSFSFIGLSDTDNLPVANGLLKWNAGTSSIEYVTSISSSYISGLQSVATSGLYSDLTGVPNLTLYALNSSLATVATSGDFNDLINAPVMSNYALISGLGPICYNPSYSYLTGTPTIPTNSSFTFIGLADTQNPAVSDGFLKWNFNADEVEYVTTIPASIITDLKPVATSGMYNDLAGKPDLSLLALNSSISAIGFSGDFNDIILNKPTNATYSFLGLNDTNNTPVANAFVKWDATASELVYVTNVSATNVTGLAPVATLGTYASLTGLPTLFNGAYSSLTGVPSTFAPTSHTHDYATEITGLPTIPSLINDLTDVLISSPVNGQVLKWSSANSKWINGAYSDFVNLGDVSPTPISNGYLRWNTAADTIIFETEIWADNITGLADVATSGDLGDLANVSINAPLNGYALLYNSTTQKWESQPNASVNLGLYNLNDLGDVVISTPTTGDFLKFNGTNWVDAPITYGDIVGTPTSASYTFLGLSDTNNSPVSNGILRWNGAGSQINYQAQLSAATDISGLAPVATLGTYSSLTGLPVIPTNLNGLSDVTIGSLLNGYVLTYDSVDSQWKGKALDVPVLSLDQLSNVTCPSPSVGDSITWTGTEWVNAKVLYSNLNGAPTLATVATTGNYSDLLNIPAMTITGLADVYNTPMANTFLKWDNTGSEVIFAYINVTDVQNLKQVAITGNWNDLLIKPLSSDFSFTGLQQTNDTPVANGYLRWNASASQIDYSATLSVNALTEVTGLASVATVGTLDSLDDVDTTGVGDGYVLVYDSGTTSWVAATSSNASSWSVFSTNQTAVNTSAFMIDTTAGSVTVTLPAFPNDNDYVRIADYAGTFNINPCVVTSAADDINGFSRDLNLTRKNMSVELTFRTGEGWKITGAFGEETTWRVVTANTTAVTPVDSIMVNTVSNIVEVTLPASPEIGDRVSVCDYLGSFPVNKCVIKRNGKKIMGVADDVDITTENASIELTYVGGTVEWKITQGVGELAITATDIFVDLDIHVDTSGSDVTGVGTISSPYASIAKALQTIDRSFIASDVFVSIKVGAGVFTSTSELEISHAYGNRIKITGVAPSLSTTITSVNGTPTLTSFSINVSSTSGITAGDYVKITSTVGTGDHEVIEGVYEVISIPSSGVININPNYQGVVGTLTGIILTGGTVTKQPTILKYNGCHGIRVSNQHLKFLEDVTIVGDNTANKHALISGNVYGVASANNAGGSIELGDNVNVYLFGGYSIYASNGGYINADKCTSTRNGGGLYCGYNAVISAINCQINNIVDVGVLAEYNGVIDVNTAIISGCGSQALYANNRGVIKADSVTIDDKNNLNGATAIVHAKGMSTIFIPDYTGGAVTYSPTWNTTGNGNSFIGLA